MKYLNLALTLACFVALAAGNGLPQGVDYSQYDPDKLQERYNIIQALVQPRANYRPKIGSAYAQKGRSNKINYGYQPANYVKQPTYAPARQATPYAPARQATPYAPARQATPYAPARQATPYAPVKNTGYAYNNYANRAPAAPVNYGFQSYGGIRFGGGKVHPVFNNDLLYKNKGLGSYGATDPIFLGGSPTKAAPSGALKTSSFRAQAPYNTYNKLSSPQIDAYNNRPSSYNYPYYG